jgi:2-oxoglutarate ferredoxin oxidoreductase subunit beta
VDIKNGVAIDDLLVHDEKAEEPSLAYLLSRMVHPEFPECFGVFRAVERPTFEDLVMGQISETVTKRGPGDLTELFRSDDLWTVE